MGCWAGLYLVYIWSISGLYLHILQEQLISSHRNQLLGERAPATHSANSKYSAFHPYPSV